MGTHRKVQLGIIVIVAFAACFSALPPPTPATADGSVTITWSTRKRTLDDGRRYFVRAPECSPAGARGCQEFLGHERAVIINLHGAGGAEDRDTASGWLGGLHSLSRDTIFVFGVSKDGSRQWDAGLCCTSEPVDDVGYLERVVNDVAASWAVDRRAVGAMGLSNGGMLALRVACERPDLIRTAAALAATYDGTCDRGRVRIAQWHGAVDTTVPLDGGTTTVRGTTRTYPPVASLAERMAGGSVFQLRVIPGRGHSMTWTDFRQATLWLVARLPGHTG
jgi:poly(3-hydroxybutyrate) depolymerase